MVVQHGDVRENRTPARRQERERERERDLRTHHTQRTFVITSQHYEPMNLHVENILLESCDKIQAHRVLECTRHEWRLYSTSLPLYRYSQADIRASSLVRLLHGEWHQQVGSISSKMQTSQLYTEARLLQASLNNLTMQTSLSLEQFLHIHI